MKKSIIPKNKPIIKLKPTSIKDIKAYLGKNILITDLEDGNKY